MSSTGPLQITKAQATPELPSGHGRAPQNAPLTPAGWLTAPAALELHRKQIFGVNTLSSDAPGPALDAQYEQAGVDLVQALAAGKAKFEFHSIKSAKPVSVDAAIWRTPASLELWQGNHLRQGDGNYTGPDAIPYIEKASLATYGKGKPRTAATPPGQIQKEFLAAKFAARRDPTNMTLDHKEAMEWARERLGKGASEEEVKKKAKSFQAQAGRMACDAKAKRLARSPS